MSFLTLLQFTFGKVVETFSHNWPLLLLSIVISVALKLYVDQDAVARFLRRNTKNSVLLSTGIAVTTPFCSCGTTAVVLGMIASTVPWAPIVAFMVASPLTSPQELFYSAGLFGWPFAITFFVASIILGLVGGGVAAFTESKGWLTDQARLAYDKSRRTELQPFDHTQGKPVPVTTTFIQPQALLPISQTLSYASTTFSADDIRPERSRRTPASTPACACDSGADKKTVTYVETAREAFNTTWRLLALFFSFTFIGYFLNGLIPNEWIQILFGAGKVYSIPLAATLGLPFYLNTEASIPLVRALLDAGMSQGAALAFLITGAGTSLGALAGALTIARWRVISIVLGTLWAGSIVLGTGYDLLINML
jgi:uncharacterized membrane protein YraQ (UPF0718 family)